MSSRDDEWRQVLIGWPPSPWTKTIVAVGVLMFSVTSLIPSLGKSSSSVGEGSIGRKRCSKLDVRLATGALARLKCTDILK